MTIDYSEELETLYKEKFPVFTKDILAKEIVLYGAGSLGRMAVNLMGKKGIHPLYIVDKSQTGTIDGIEIKKPDQISASDKTNVLFLICIATVPYNEINLYLKSLECGNTMQFYTWAYLNMPELLGNGWFKHDVSEEDKAEIEKICLALSHDSISLAHYLQFLWWKLRIKEVIFEQSPVLSGKKYFKSPCLPALSEYEVLLDGGAHFGETIEEFLEKTGNRFNAIYAFEPDKDNLRFMKNKFHDSRIIYSDNALYDKSMLLSFCDGLGFASKITALADGQQIQAVKIDDLHIKPTIIKLHVEGDELKALEGAIETIKEYRPIIMVLADHCEDGLYKIPRFIKNLSHYTLYFNLHDYCGNTAIFYAVPVERLEK